MSFIAAVIFLAWLGTCLATFSYARIDYFEPAVYGQLDADKYMLATTSCMILTSPVGGLLVLMVVFGVNSTVLACLYILWSLVSYIGCTCTGYFLYFLDTVNSTTERTELLTFIYGVVPTGLIFLGFFGLLTECGDSEDDSQSGIGRNTQLIFTKHVTVQV